MILTELMRVRKLDQSDTDNDAPKEPVDQEDDLGTTDGDVDAIRFDDDDEFDGEDTELEDPDDTFQLDDENDSGVDGSDEGFEDPELDDLIPDEGNGGESAEPEDPNRAGVIRYVKGAHLVYKREQEDGTYEEMWIFNSGKFKQDINTKKAIVAGTDIPPNATRSPDGAQELKMWSAGNADVVVITGLPQ